jgi:hypothetical protein
MEQARQRHGSADYRAAEGIMRDVFVRLVNERYDDELAALRCPVELVWGDDDADVPIAVAAAVAGPGCRPPPSGGSRRRPSDPPDGPRPCCGPPSTGPWVPGDGAPGRRGGRLLAGLCLAGIRWLRVAQREHYLPGSAHASPPAGGATALNGGQPRRGRGRCAPGRRWPATGFATAVVVAAGPAASGSGAGPRLWPGRAGPGPWPPSALGLLAGAVALCEPRERSRPSGWRPERWPWPSPSSSTGPAAITGPFERAAAHRMSGGPNSVSAGGPHRGGHHRFLRQDSTKGYVAHLLAGSRTVVASPASFNNRAGLARAVNENLADGTDVFVAEMGTYGPGEIADLCSWLPPDIAVITAIGPVHLERFGIRGPDRGGQGGDPGEGPDGRPERR